MAVDMPVFPYDSFIAANRNRTYRNRMKEMARAFLNFMQDNGLFIKTLVSVEQEIPTNLCVMESDLTEEGKVVVRIALDRWLGIMDRRQKKTDVVVLERALQEIRRQKQN